MNDGANQPNRKPYQRRSQTAATTDRLPPYAEEAERGVLSCILLDARNCLPECVARFRAAPVFYDLKHQTIFDALTAMQEAQVGIDVITLHQWLKDRNVLEQVGGQAYVQELPDVASGPSFLGDYLESVWEKYLLRNAIRACGEAIAEIYESQGDVYALLDRLEARVLAVNESRGSAELGTMPALMGQAIDLVEKMHRGVGLIGGVATHFGYFDKMTGGLWPGEMFILAGRPSLGKTSLAMNIARNIAKIQKKAVGVFSLEMTALQLTIRLWCTEGEVDFSKLRTGFISHEAMSALVASAGKVSKLPLFIDDTSGLSILELRAKARRMVQQQNVGVFVIDYLQLLHSTSERAQNREQEVADISKGLKGMAKELNVPVIVLSQLNREAEKRKWAKPQLSDLRESGAIEQDADLVGILYRPKSEDGEDNDDAPEIFTNLHVVKQRNGPTGDVEFHFRRWCLRFEDKYHNTGKAAPALGQGISKIDDSVDRMISQAVLGTSNIERSSPGGPQSNAEVDPAQRGEF